MTDPYAKAKSQWSEDGQTMTLMCQEHYVLWLGMASEIHMIFEN